nr:hypothetical protein [Tanacetum cinerariifolium]
MDVNLVVMESIGIESKNNSLENTLSKLVNETQMQMQMQEGKVDMESSGTKSEEHDTKNMSGNDIDTADAVIKLVNDQEPLAEDLCLLEKVDSITTPDSTNMSHMGGKIDQNGEKVNTRIKVQSPKTRNSNKPVEPKIHTQKLGRQIVTGHRFSLNKSSTVHEKTNTLRSCLRWIHAGRTFNTVGLRWVPTGNTFTPSTTKVDNEPPNGSNEDITNPYECEQTLSVRACDIPTISSNSYCPNSQKKLDQQYPTLAKIPVLDTGKFEQWQFRIQQYLQLEHYALWEVIEFGDSYKAPTNTDSAESRTGRTISPTTEDMQKKKNDVKTRTTLLLSLPDEHQLRFSKYKTTKELWAAILKLLVVMRPQRRGKRIF